MISFWYMTLTKQSVIFIVGFVALGFFLFAPRVDAVGLEADAMCNPVILQCGCGQIMGSKGCIGGPNMWKCPCYDTTNTFGSSGICVAPMKCLAQSTGGPDGFGLDIVKSMLGELMKKLMQGGGGGGGGGGGSGTGPDGTGGPTGCGSYVATSDVTQVSTSNTGGVCYYYQSPVSSLLSGNDTTNGNGLSLSEQLNALTDNNANTLTNNNANTSDTLNRQLNARVSTSTPTTTRTILTQGVQGALISGIRGDMQVFGNGVTILAASVDASGNSSTAGFYGASSVTGQPVNTIVNLCKGRPWSKHMLSYALPPTFFDSLCIMRGYSVGTAPAAAPSVKIVQKVATSSAATTTAPVLPPKVSIWSVPPTVPLGSRTSIFWTSQGVKDCTITSPDGAFSQTAPAGSASTVALTKTTAFTIACVAPDGKPFTDSVTVNLSQ